MKVTVCFGDTKVVVPVGDGNGVYVRDLTDAALVRYKKARQKDNDCVVQVQKLKSADGGILDPDDLLVDVVEDKEQIVAIYDEHEPVSPYIVHVKSNGCSNHKTSDDNVSPYLHHSSDAKRFPAYESSTVNEEEKRNGHVQNSVFVDDVLPTTSNLLTVRRGSEPVLNKQEQSNEKRKAGTKHVDFSETEKSDSRNEEDNRSRFARTTARKSRITDEWLEVAALAADNYRAKHATDDDGVEQISIRLSPAPDSSNDSRLPWDLDLEPLYEGAVIKALIVRGVSAESAYLDEDILIGDKIMSIDQRPIEKWNFNEATNYLRNAAERRSGVNFLVHRQRRNHLNDLPSPVYPDVNGITTSNANPSAGSGPKAPAPVVPLQKGNTRRIGQRVSVELVKQPPPGGFGFTLTTRDNETSSGEVLVYVKTILSNGAAVDDGRLRPGDRLLEVNGQRIGRNFGQKEVVQLLRNAKTGESVSLLVSRHFDAPNGSAELPSPALPRRLVDDMQLDENRCQLLTFDIPLNDTGCAGLGLQMKGRMAKAVPGEDTRRDGGIFVKSILHGGAVHKDGRLQVNDQVIAVNGEDLRGLSNPEALTRLRTILLDLKPATICVRLAVLRRKTSLAERNGKSDGAERSASNSLPSDAPPKLSYGDDDYATVVKWPSSTLKVVNWPNSEDDEPSVMMDGDTGTRVRLSRSDSTVSSRVRDDNGLFVRDAPMRRSMSEKRHGAAAKNDPSSSATYQRIQHQRQTSAPALQRRPIGGSLSKKAQEVKSNGEPLTAGRRSLSVESVNQHAGKNGSAFGPVQSKPTDRPLLHEQVAQSLNKSSATKSTSSGIKWMKSKTTPKRPTNESFRQAVDKSYFSGGTEVGVDVDEECEPDKSNQPGIPQSITVDSFMNVQNRGKTINKDKDRRKSAGSGMSIKNWFRFGSGGKANRPMSVMSPDIGARSSLGCRANEETLQKDAQEAKRRAMEEIQRIQPYYERWKEQDRQQQRQLTPENGDKSAYAAPSKKPSQWKPPPPPQMSPNKARQMSPQPPYHPNVHHAKQHSESSLSNNNGRLHSQFEPPDYYSHYYRQYVPMPAQRNAPDYYGTNNRYVTYSNASPQKKRDRSLEHQNGWPPSSTGEKNCRYNPASIDNGYNPASSPPSSSSWFVNGVGSSRTSREHGLYYSSMDGRGSERTAIIETNGRDSGDQRSLRVNGQPTSQAINGRARCTSDHVDNWKPEKQSLWSAPDASPIGTGTSQVRYSNVGSRLRSPEAPRRPSSRIIDSIPTSDRPPSKSRHVQNGGVTRIFLGDNGEAIRPSVVGPPPVPPPDYEEYLRTRKAKPPTSRPPRPHSEYRLSDEADRYQTF